MKIGELAKAAGTDVETIRYYEREGLIPQPARTGAAYRSYGEPVLERLRFIRRCRALDMTLEEIRTLLGCRDHPADSCEVANRVVADHLKHVTARIGELVALEKELKGIRRRCKSVSAAKDCGILEELGAAAALPAKATHLGGTHKKAPRYR